MALIGGDSHHDRGIREECLVNPRSHAEMGHLRLVNDADAPHIPRVHSDKEAAPFNLLLFRAAETAINNWYDQTKLAA
jgi:hypothetical protein